MGSLGPVPCGVISSTGFEFLQTTSDFANLSDTPTHPLFPQILHPLGSLSTTHITIIMTDITTMFDTTRTIKDDRNHLLSRATKFNYGVGDFGNNIIWHTLGMFLAYFYTDVYGLHPAHMGTMYLAVRIFDAITDPLVGMWVDRSRTKYGQCRPFILFGGIPLAISFVMLFYTPDFGGVGKIVYAYFSYSLLTLAYTIVNVPYSTMAGTLTEDSDDRTSLQSYRFGIGMLASVFVAAALFPSVEFFGNGDEQKGYFYTVLVFSFFVVFCLYYCFRTVNEKYLPELEEEETRLKDVLSDLRTAISNVPLLLLLTVNVIFIVSLMVRAAAQIYYVDEVLVNADHLLPTFMALGTAAATLGAAMSALLWGRFDKPVVCRILMFICGLLSGIVFWFPGTAILPILIIGLISTFLHLSIVPLTWSMVSDTVDYQRSLTGRYLGGLFFALFLFSLKIGTGVGGAVLGWVLGATGYEAGVTESERVVTAINFISTLLPGLLFISGGLVMCFYKLDRRKREEIRIKLRTS